MMGIDFVRRDSDSVKWDLADGDVLPMWVADMDFPVDRGIIDALSERLRHPFMGYSFLPESYFEAFLGWTRTYQGWEPDRSWLAYSPSVMAAVRLAVRQYSAEGQGIIIPAPVYYPFFSAAKDQGRRPVEAPLAYDARERRYRFDFDLLETLCADPANPMLLLCNPHNPLGRVWEEGELSALAELCIRHEVCIVSDEIHADIVYPGSIFVPMVALMTRLGRPDLCMAVQAPSKTFNIPGLLSSHMIIPDEGVRRTMEAAVAAAGVDLPNILAMTASRAAYSSSRPWLDATLDTLLANRNRLTDFLGKVLPGEAEHQVPEGTYLYWIDLRSAQKRRGVEGKAAFKQIKHQARLWLSPGYMFGGTASGFYRLNFACPPELLEEGLDRLGRWIG
jgi:cystathionine beta-lyase